ncbi:hypothetical protein JCM3770_004488 [Rhodotorula araucariae]
MANLQRKPALHLSVSSTAPPTPGDSHAGSISRRFGSWGSATSDTYHTLSAYGDQSMTPLPSPLEGREWGFLGGDGDGAPSGSWQSGWLAGSVGTSGRPRSSSIFAEFRDPSIGFGGASAGGRGENWPSASVGRGGATEFGAFPRTSPDSEESTLEADGRRQPSRSKTLSFFGSADEPSRALSPPPNPPSRNNSLNQRGPRASTALPPSPGWDMPQDPLRASIASSSGGSWLDDAADRESLWTRGRGGSIGSIASTEDAGWQVPSARTPRHASPSRLEVEERDTPSPLAALRPRLAALNTLSASPSSSRSASPIPYTFPPKPLANLPTAVEPAPRSRFIDFEAPPNTSSRSSTLRDFVSLDEHPTPSSSRLPSGAVTPDDSAALQSRQKVSSSAESSAPTINPAPHDEEPAPLRQGDRVGDYIVQRVLGKGSFSRVALARLAKGKGRDTDAQIHARTASRDAGADGGLVALKLIGKKSYETNERMRISVMREAEVLKNIQHPSLVSLFTSFTTPIYTALVLDYCEGGELFDFLAEWHLQVTDSLARRIFGELCSAVGWMHDIGLVHRDIKLENILLTSRPFPHANPSSVLSSLPSPFVKLTDFGLSRFINPASPLLATRCGSEEYAAPELIMGKKYDGRQTDAWALGVVLFAVITGVMPFVEAAGSGPRVRKAYLLKIAKADYRWPGSLSRAPSLSTTAPIEPSHLSHAASASEPDLPTVPPPPSARLVTPAVQALVGRLLMRDPAKRAAVAEVWDSEWMDGEGRPPRLRGTVRGSSMPEWARRGSEFLDE